MNWYDWKIKKTDLENNESLQDKYSKIADRCNESQEYHIELYIDENDIEWYRVVANAKPTTEELQEQVKQVCANYINDISWRVERYNTQKTVGIETSDTEEIYLKILEYMQYCRDFDEQEGEWWLSNPLTFEEWKNISNSTLSEKESEEVIENGLQR